MDRQAAQTTPLVAQLQQALRKQEFQLHYQPKFDVASGHITGAEALLRWQHPTRGLLQPKDFLAPLEESGAMPAASRWVLKSVCFQLRAWLDAGIDPVPVAVNLSAAQLHMGLDAYIADVLTAYQLDARWLHVEASESVLRHDVSEATSSLLYVKAIGVKLLLDDFGTASSSLRALQVFPVDGIKLDCTLLGGTTIHSDGAAIFEAVVGLARRLNLDVVAEGVETEAQWRFLKANDCQEAQGYLLAKPMPVDHFSKLISYSQGVRNMNAERLCA